LNLHKQASNSFEQTGANFLLPGQKVKQKVFFGSK